MLTRDFDRTIKRKPFVSPKDPPHEKRFEFQNDYLQGNILSSSKKVQSISLDKTQARDEKLIQKGGNLTKLLIPQSDAFYDLNKDALLCRL